jgi:predicted porin
LSGNQATASREDTPVQIQTGLLPSALGIGAKTRQNDLDVAVQFSFFMGSNQNGSDNLSNSTTSNGGLGYSSLNIRQSYLTFGDKSWGSVLVGRNLGVFGSDAILSDMTLLGVGSGAGGAGGSSTLGRIGSGYLYADWKAQMAYTTPNFNGFTAVVAVTEMNGQIDRGTLGYEGKINFDFGSGDSTGKLWVGGKSGDIQTAATATSTTALVTDHKSEAFDFGGKVANGGAELVAYYYTAKNADSGNGTYLNTYGTATADLVSRENHGGYIQGTYKLPGVGTKVGLSYGKSVIERAASDTADAEREATIVGLYHPLTKHVNIVAEYNHLDVNSHNATTGKAQTGSLGAILFF